MGIDDLEVPDAGALEYGADYPALHFSRLERKALADAIRERQEFSSRGFVDLARIMASDMEGALSRVLPLFRDTRNKTFWHSRPGFELLMEREANTTLTDVWGTESGKVIADNYLKSIRPQDTLGALIRYCKNTPVELGAIVAASGSLGSSVQEGQPKPLIQQTLNRGELPEHKVAGLCVVSKELVLATEGSARSLFENELTKAVVRSANDTVMSLVTPASTIGATADAVADLSALLGALPDSTNYVVATTGERCRTLALASQNNMPISGGEFIPGVHILPVIEPGSDSSEMVGFCCDRVVVADHGLKLRRATQASVDMAESPSSPAQLVSLWQCGLRGLLVERKFRLHAEAEAVVEVA